MILLLSVFTQHIPPNQNFKAQNDWVVFLVELAGISVFMHLNMHVLCMCTLCACVWVCVRVCVIVETVYHYFWVVEVWHSGWESCGRHSQKSGFIPKRECKQSIRMNTEHTHKHTHSLSLILPADPLVILGTAWHEEREEIHNEH